MSLTLTMNEHIAVRKPGSRGCMVFLDNVDFQEQFRPKHEKTASWFLRSGAPTVEIMHMKILPIFGGGD